MALNSSLSIIASQRSLSSTGFRKNGIEPNKPGYDGRQPAAFSRKARDSHVQNKAR
jgi:hypothetical protein